MVLNNSLTLPSRGCRAAGSPLTDVDIEWIDIDTLAEDALKNGDLSDPENPDSPENGDGDDNNGNLGD